MSKTLFTSERASGRANRTFRSKWQAEPPLQPDPPSTQPPSGEVEDRLFAVPPYEPELESRGEEPDQAGGGGGEGGLRSLQAGIYERAGGEEGR